MTITLDGYKVSRTQRLEDLTTGLGTSLSALAEQVWEENPMSSTFRQTKLEEELFGGFIPGTKGAQFKGPPSPVLGKIDADKKVSDAGVKLDIGERGIPEGALDLMIERKREEVKRKALIDAAPEGFWSGAAQIGTALAVSIADPINVASAFVPVVGLARYTKLVANTSTAVGRSAVRAGVGVTEGLVGAALVEPVILLAAEAEQAEYGMYDSFLNLTFGAVLGGGLHTGLGAIGDAIGRGSPKLKEDMLRAANGQVMDNRPIDVGYVAKTDPTFRAEWRDSQVARAIEGAEVDARVKTEFNRAMDELRPELITRAGEFRSDVSARVIDDLEAGRVPDVFIDDVAKVVKGRIDDFEAPAPKLDSKSPEASPLFSQEAQKTLDDMVEPTPENLETLTDDILTALDEQEVDTKTVRAEIEEINETAARDEAGLREALNCMLGK
jgi:hypothetical protein